MTICPIAIAVGCRKCPVFSVCPATRLIGDQVAEPAAAEPTAAAKKSAKQKKSGKRR